MKRKCVKLLNLFEINHETLVHKLHNTYQWKLQAMIQTTCCFYQASTPWRRSWGCGCIP